MGVLYVLKVLQGKAGFEGLFLLVFGPTILGLLRGLYVSFVLGFRECIVKPGVWWL